ncbi:urease accessory protein [Nitrosospira multiformis ATCC 25196]|uniref:Urease accessory protein UreF n=2 Tax=Nitrosospira multiformis (strain ATCC 25196 / NCIMB 11849 / C 71) TaxID=323848 RepID=UREF_NITMU|nr:urease accessory protein UreF [Nitrosospira multiformis]Q2Y9M5.1 RecName: Full=Urease accessory protein UreF [Nitrosospira multiformis ATCC 25196]ABB74546.1 Urease accessory protein UreF [Nitrosospira multiformis ATCC 25196]SEF89312.1 urease accessory protein [Nitrosospira multiformis ATCC 25196]
MKEYRALLALLHLASPSLPIGAYTYSQGLESAIEQGLVRDETSAREWLVEMLGIFTDFELPILQRLLKAFSERDEAAVSFWTECFVASRETSEFRAETVQMGYSLAKLVIDLKLGDDSMRAILENQQAIPLPTAFACAAEALGIPHEESLLGMLFSMAENQVLACVKSVPLGQLSGQRLLLSLHPVIEACSIRASQLTDDELSSWAPGLSLLSMQHEVQYSRIYRS